MKKKVLKIGLIVMILSAIILTTTMIWLTSNNSVKEQYAGLSSPEIKASSENTTSSGSYLKLIDASLGTSGEYMIVLDENHNIWGIGTSLEATIIESDIKFAKVSRGTSHNLAIDESGKLYSWGINTYGQLGTNDNNSYNEPTPIMEDIIFKEIYAVMDYSIAIDEEDNIYAWGRNDYGQLGDGTTTDRNCPLTIAGDIKYKELYASGATVCCIDQNDVLYGWRISGHRRWKQ